MSLDGGLRYSSCNSITFAVSELVLSGQVWVPRWPAEEAGASSLCSWYSRVPTDKDLLSLLGPTPKARHQHMLNKVEL